MLYGKFHLCVQPAENENDFTLHLLDSHTESLSAFYD